MTTFDLNDRVITAVGAGMAAAAERFSQRMEELHERRNEQKASQTFFEIGLELAKQVDRQTDQLQLLQDQLRHQTAELERTEAALRLADIQKNAAARYIGLVIQRLREVEGILQRQSAYSFALDEFRKTASDEIQSGVAGNNPLYTDTLLRDAFLKDAYNSFMKTTNVKKGPPEIPLTVAMLIHPATVLNKPK